MKLTKLLVALAALAIGVTACNDNPSGPSTIPSGVWKLGTLQRPNWSVVEIPDPDRFTAEFRDDGQLEVRADCNGCGGAYESNAGTLSIGVMFCTAAFCLSSPLDTTYAAVLQSAAPVLLGKHTVCDDQLLRVPGERSTQSHAPGRAVPPGRAPLSRRAAVRAHQPIGAHRQAAPAR